MNIFLHTGVSGIQTGTSSLEVSWYAVFKRIVSDPIGQNM
jgi:hypothetical protein